MVWLFKALSNVIRNVVFSLLAIIIGWFSELSRSSDTFFNIFKIGETNLLNSLYINIIVPLAVSIVILNMVYQLYRGMFTKSSNDVDDPFSLSARSFICLFFVFEAQNAINIIQTRIMNPLWEYLDKVTSFSDVVKGMSVSALLNDTFDNVIGDGARNIIVTAMGEGIIIIVCTIISIIIGFFLGWKFIKMMFIYVTRYVENQYLIIFSPVGISFGGSISTKEISKRYIRMILSSFASLFLSAITTYLYCYAMAYTLSWSGDGISENIISFFVTLSIYDMFLRIDAYFDKLGITNVSNTKDNFGLYRNNPVSMMAMAATNFARGGRNAMTNGEGIGAGAKGMATAAAGGAKGMSGILGGIIGGKVADFMKSPSAEEKTKAAGDKIMNAMNAAEANSNANSNTETFASAINPQAFHKNGQSVTPDNSGMAIINMGKEDVMDANNPGAVKLQNIGMDGKTGQWQDLQSGDVISDEDFQNMGKTIDENYGNMFAANIAKANMNPTDSANVVSALEKNSAKVGNKNNAVQTAYGMFHGENGNHYAEFIKNKDGAWNTIANGENFYTPEEAAEALGADGLDIYSGQPKLLSQQRLHQSGYDYGAPVDNSSNSSSGKNSSDFVNEFGATASGINNGTYSNTSNDTSSSGATASGINNGTYSNTSNDTSGFGAAASGINNGVYSNTSNGTGGSGAAASGINNGTYSNTANDISGSGAAASGINNGTYSNTSNDTSGSGAADLADIQIGNAMKNLALDVAGISGGATRSPLPINKGYKVIESGGGQIHGVYADMNNNLHGFSGKVVSQQEANKYRSECAPVTTSSGTQYIRFSDGTTNKNVLKFMKENTFQNNQFVNKYSHHSSLDENGMA